MNARQIEYVLAVAKHHSLRKAGAAVFATEGSMSIQIGKLEDELDMKLFCRARTQGMPLILTDEGKQILPDLEFYLQVHNDVFRRAESIREKSEQREKEASHA